MPHASGMYGGMRHGKALPGGLQPGAGIAAVWRERSDAGVGRIATAWDAAGTVDGGGGGGDEVGEESVVLLWTRRVACLEEYGLVVLCVWGEKAKPRLHGLLPQKIASCRL